MILITAAGFAVAISAVVFTIGVGLLGNVNRVNERVSNMAAVE